MLSDELQIPGSEQAVSLLAIGFGLFAVFFGVVVVVIVVSASKRYRAARTAGLDPFAGDIQVMGALAHSAALAPERPVADRLAEIERLYQQRQITEAERDAARARILGAA